MPMFIATMPKSKFILRELYEEDREAYADMLYRSFNSWYARRGWDGDYFRCTPSETGIFFDIYHDLTPGCSIAAIDRSNGRIAGACFFHPREHHVSLGIMSVHPGFFGQGVGRLLVREIIDFAERSNSPAIRLVGSAVNMDSFSLYNRSGFIPRQFYQDMVLTVPTRGFGAAPIGRERVRPARLDDVAAMRALELELSGICREPDYRYAIINPRDILEASVIEACDGGIDGFVISVKHQALNMIGPLVARCETDAAALIAQASERFRGKTVLLAVPTDCRYIVEMLYVWGGRNVETHLFQVRGRFQPFTGVSLPSFLPETG